jgi:hypothetical protein
MKYILFKQLLHPQVDIKFLFMRKLICVLGAIILLVSTSVAQSKMRRLPGSINHPSVNVFAPFISADASTLVFVSDNTEDNVLAPFFTFRENNDWREPQPLPKHIYTRMSFLWGNALSSDGKKLYFSTLKSQSVGGFDIWTSELRGSIWSEPVNLAPPVNSKLHDAAPSFNPEGTTMYFMRCEKMDQNKADNCKIYSVSKKPNGEWGEPAELPSSINTGNSQSPRIMADGQTLVFASNKFPGSKGGMDLYVTRMSNGSWSKPVPLDFVNTEKDEQYVSVAALGRYLLKDEKGKYKNEIVEYLIPDALRPKGMMKIDGKVTDASGVATPAYVSLTDIKTNQRVFTGRPNRDGAFLAYIMEGSTYELAVDPEKDNFTFFTKRFDLTTDKIPQIEKVNAVVKPAAPGDEFVLEHVKFQPNSSELDVAESATELRRLLRVVKANPNLKFEIQVMLKGYEEDSVRSSEDLTEVYYDSIADTYDEIDTLGQLYQKDTVYVLETWHNDRTLKQSQSIIRYLVSQGASESNFSFFGNTIEATLPEEKRLTVKAVVRAK